MLPKVALIVALIPLFFATAPAAQTEVELPLIRALETGDRAKALILLEPLQDLTRLARLKDEVLANLPAGSFRLGYRFEGLPLVAGEVTATAVRALLLDGRARRVGLDGRVEAVLSQSTLIVGAPTVHNLGFTGKGVTVAVLDSGIETDHPDLSDNLAPGAYHFLAAGQNVGTGAEDDFGHGTRVSGWTSDQVAAINHVVTNRTNWANLAAINMSLGTSSKYSVSPCDSVNATTQALAAAINAAKAADIAVFAAAGNGASTISMPAPACIGNAVSVGATYDQGFARVTWSNCTDNNPVADQIVCITDRMAGGLDLLAPGALLSLPDMGGGVQTGAGNTSYACPHAAAAAALLRQALRGLGPTALESGLKNSGKPIQDAALNTFHPRLDVAAALLAQPRLEPLDPFRVGFRVRYRLTAQNSPAAGYQAAASLATAPKLPLGGGKFIALAFDNLMIASFNLPAIFEGFQGALSSRGEKIIFVNVPGNPQLVGTTIYLGFFTFASVVQEVSWPLKQTVLS